MLMTRSRSAAWVFLLPAVISPARAEEFRFKERLLPVLTRQVPGILKTFNPKTGRFGSGVWICTDQNRIYPLAVAYATRGEGNPYYKDPRLLEAVVKGGDALLADADAEGRWVFRKKDGSEWGKIRMPWTYSRWIRAFSLVRDDMPADRRAAWDRALTRAYEAILQKDLNRFVNIPTHHAMGLYIAGRLFDREDFRTRAGEFLRKVAAAQAEGGYWPEETDGPVIQYHFVYIEALGIYHALSGDPEVRPALERGIRFLSTFTYPDGRPVETVDGRNPYHAAIRAGNAGVSLTPEGRAWLRRQWDLPGGTGPDEDEAATFLLYGSEGEYAPDAAADGGGLRVLTEGGMDRAAILRKGPWFVCLSAYTAPVSRDRWHQDRQNVVSVWHEKDGLILGGGNTKLQPLWSTFCVGNPSGFRHKAGDTKPDFLPPPGLFHVPSAATLVREPEPGLDLTYGPETCRLRVRPVDDRRLVLTLETTAASGAPVAAHVTLMPPLWKGNTPIAAYGKVPGGGRLALDLVTLRFPEDATMDWASPHNPYRKDGRAEVGEGRVVVRIPFSKDRSRCEVGIEVGP